MNGGYVTQDCGLVDTICQALKDNSSTGRQGVKGGLDPSARSEKDKSADRARSVSIHAA